MNLNLLRKLILMHLILASLNIMSFEVCKLSKCVETKLPIDIFVTVINDEGYYNDILLHTIPQGIVFQEITASGQKTLSGYSKINLKLVEGQEYQFNDKIHYPEGSIIVGSMNNTTILSDENSRLEKVKYRNVKILIHTFSNYPNRINFHRRYFGMLGDDDHGWQDALFKEI
ncbi:hypothetical protein N9N67_09235 [Bacteriovoracaceae bacterium]|nr:hypothetical protein [Bacteriovoracaceae bacterium]